MKKILFILSFILTGCASTSDLFHSIQNSSEPNYGYEVNSPILIGRYNSWQKNTKLAYFYLSKLSKDGKLLKMIYHATVIKPNDQPRKRKPIPNLYGVTSSMGGEYLDLWGMMLQGTSDTIKLYFDVEIAGELKIPEGLDFNINQQNNIFQ